MYQQILDREGRSYAIAITEDEGLISVKAYDHQTLIGEAKCLRESPETLYLRDIAIANQVVKKTIYLRAKSLKQLLSYSSKTTNYRARGLGSALLNLLINYAAANGVRCLYGRVYQQDLENNPKLLEWYQSHGFELREPHLEEQPDVLALIYLVLCSL
jgi:hypothetical protein